MDSRSPLPVVLIVVLALVPFSAVLAKEPRGEGHEVWVYGLNLSYGF